jgi:hypothetical protein
MWGPPSSTPGPRKMDGSFENQGSLNTAAPAVAAHVGPSLISRPLVYSCNRPDSRSLLQDRDF